jgi:hypothetical protein
MTDEHRTEIKQMLTAFRTRARELFQPTTPDEFKVYGKGTYGLLYAKPKWGVRQLLAIDREVLVLATSFPDLHARTNTLAIELIDGSDGRLERTVAIVIHRDPDGDAKLRNWGRDVGLTVIPLFMGGADLPSGTELERRLLAEFFSRDPFDVTGPVSDDNEFYGRRDEAQDLARQLQEGQVRSCLGIRKIGKTSVLHRVLAILQDYHDCYTIVVDCSKDSVWQMNAPQLLGAIAGAIPRAVKSEDYCAEVSSGTPQDLTRAYRDLIESLRSTAGTVVLMMDETDYITPGSPTARHWRSEFNPFWRNLRAAYQEVARSPARLSVLVGGVSSKWFLQESIDSIENAALAFLPEEYLAPISQGASVAMIQRLGRTSGLIFEEGAAAVIAETCSNLPFWIRKAGSYVHRHIEVEPRPLTISHQQARLLADAFIRSEGASIAEVALSHLFRVYPELRPVAAACVSGDASAHSAFLRNTLHKYGIISTPSAYPDISGRMMAAGLELALSNDRAAGATDAPSGSGEPLRFDSLNEWAEELAAVGAQRNVVEKRLRFLVLNFLRYDVLQQKQKGSLADRLLRGIEERRRVQLQHLPPDELVEKYMWLDLVRLIEKEWQLFAPVFGDRAQFSGHANVVNNRPDAHAKDADRADLAAYRASVYWLEDALARAG